MDQDIISGTWGYQVNYYFLCNLWYVELLLVGSTFVDFLHICHVLTLYRIVANLCHVWSTNVHLYMHCRFSAEDIVYCTYDLYMACCHVWLTHILIIVWLIHMCIWSLYHVFYPIVILDLHRCSVFSTLSVMLSTLLLLIYWKPPSWPFTSCEWYNYLFWTYL